MLSVQTAKQVNLIEEIIINSAIDKRIVFIVDEVNEVTMFLARHLLEKIVRIDDKENIPVGQRQPIEIRISSPGGSVIDGLSLISYIEYLKKDLRYVIKTHVLAEACSMASAICCVGTKGFRTAQRHSQIMVHQPSGGKWGRQNYQEMKEDVELIEKYYERLISIMISNTDLTREMFEDITSRKYDLYFWAEEALKHGIIDGIQGGSHD